MSNPLKEITNLPVNESVLVTPVKAVTTKPAKVKKAAAASKPIKATKAAAPKPKKAVKTAAAAKHDYPSYIDMIREAILSLENPKNGVSRIAILKFITNKYDLEEHKANAPMKRALTKAVTDGILAQKSGVGENGSFKLITDAKSTKKVAKPRKAKEPATTKAKKEPSTKKAAVAKSKTARVNESVAKQ